MRITTRIVVTIEKRPGDAVTLDRSVISAHGDNPSFERVEVVNAIDAAASQFKEVNSLAGTRPL